MSRAADGPHPHPLTPAGLPAGDEWWHGCPECHLPIQGGSAGRAARHQARFDAYGLDALRGVDLDRVPVAA
ncbi:hypothetical protein [Streptomyces reticuli]|uniref:hypothetical protein n=1 Tax=Streptomyces reticuli TaxID=1926 RepID=UPI00073DBB5D|nr:hypothetical protein TUE45_pSRTUE45b_0040 [Streptomyces reticuli]